jgi:hypothetical protein
VKLLLLNFVLVFSVYAADCSEDPFAAGCASANNNM